MVHTLVLMRDCVFAHLQCMNTCANTRCLDKPQPARVLSSSLSLWSLLLLSLLLVLVLVSLLLLVLLGFHLCRALPSPFRQGYNIMHIESSFREVGLLGRCCVYLFPP